jgi:hypothetical protein
MSGKRRLDGTGVTVATNHLFPASVGHRCPTQIQVLRSERLSVACWSDFEMASYHLVTYVSQTARAYKWVIN